MPYFIIFFLVLILAGLTVFFFVKFGAGDAPKTGNLVMGEEYLQELGTHHEGTHQVRTICLYQAYSTGWICPNCEGENPAEQTWCCICHRTRD